MCFHNDLCNGRSNAVAARLGIARFISTVEVVKDMADVLFFISTGTVLPCALIFFSTEIPSSFGISRVMVFCKITMIAFGRDFSSSARSSLMGIASFL